MNPVPSMEAVTIRPAGLDDAPAIAAIHVAAWQETYAGLLPAEDDPNQRRAGYRGPLVLHGLTEAPVGSSVAFLREKGAVLGTDEAQ